SVRLPLVIVGLPDDGGMALGENLVNETSGLLVENLTLPADQVHELGLDWREDGARHDEDGALTVPIGNVAGGAIPVQLVQVFLRHLHKLWNGKLCGCYCHGDPP